MKAVGYIRVSTRDQANEGISLDAQRGSIERYCGFKQFDLIEICEDPGVSTRHPLEKRAGGSKLLSHLESKEITQIVACKLDRLFRDTTECLMAVTHWDKKQKALHLIDMGGQAMDTQSAMGRFFITIMAGIAELERNQISDRVKFAMAHQRSQGKRISRHLPYGYKLDIDGETLIPDVEEREMIAYIHDLREGGLSYRKIVDEMNNSEYKPRCEKWHLTTIFDILKKG